MVNQARSDDQITRQSPQRLNGCTESRSADPITRQSPQRFNSYTEARSADIAPVKGLELLMKSEETGPCLLHEKQGNRLYIFNHIEYDSTSLSEEYHRDMTKGAPVELPHNYFPADNPAMDESISDHHSPFIENDPANILTGRIRQIGAFMRGFFGRK